MTKAQINKLVEDGDLQEIQDWNIQWDIQEVEEFNGPSLKMKYFKEDKSYPCFMASNGKQYLISEDLYDIFHEIFIEKRDALFENVKESVEGTINLKLSRAVDNEEAIEILKRYKTKQIEVLEKQLANMYECDDLEESPIHNTEIIMAGWFYTFLHHAEEIIHCLKFEIMKGQNLNILFKRRSRNSKEDLIYEDTKMRCKAELSCFFKTPSMDELYSLIELEAKIKCTNEVLKRMKENNLNQPSTFENKNENKTKDLKDCEWGALAIYCIFINRSLSDLNKVGEFIKEIKQKAGTEKQKKVLLQQWQKFYIAPGDFTAIENVEDNKLKVNYSILETRKKHLKQVLPYLKNYITAEVEANKILKKISG